MDASKGRTWRRSTVKNMMRPNGRYTTVGRTRGWTFQCIADIVYRTHQLGYDYFFSATLSFRWTLNFSLPVWQTKWKAIYCFYFDIWHLTVHYCMHNALHLSREEGIVCHTKLRQKNRNWSVDSDCLEWCLWDRNRRRRSHVENHTRGKVITKNRRIGFGRKLPYAISIEHRIWRSYFLP